MNSEASRSTNWKAFGQQQKFAEARIMKVKIRLSLPSVNLFLGRLPATIVTQTSERRSACSIGDSSVHEGRIYKEQGFCSSWAAS